MIHKFLIKFAFILEIKSEKSSSTSKMHGSEVEDWLYTIGAPELFDYFMQDGFSTLECVRRMRQSDIEAIVDRKGYTLLLNEAIDRLNCSPRAVAYLDSHEESRESLMNRYQYGIPTGGSLARTLARQTKSHTRKLRGMSAFPHSFSRMNSIEPYVANSASDAYEKLLANRRAQSVGVSNRILCDRVSENAEAALLARRQRRTMDRSLRAQSGKRFIF
jgi:hypothetical protein